MKTIYMVLLVVAVVVVGSVVVLAINKPAKQPLALDVNDENCKIENVLKIEDSQARQDFLKKCQAFAAMKKPVLPVVNHENCKPENIVKIEDMTARQDFREKCQAASGGVPQTKAETRADMQSEQNADTKAPGAVDILQGTTAGVGGWVVGIMHVASTGSDKKALLVVVGYPAGVAAEFTIPVVEHTLVPLGDGLHQILWIVPGTEQLRGRVGLSPVLSQQPTAPPGLAAVYIAAEGRLRVNGPEIDGASDIEVSAWNMGQTPVSVDVLWYPAQYALKDTDPKNIQRAHLKVGSSLNVGGRVLTVRSIESQTVDHPAWVRFEMAKSR